MSPTSVLALSYKWFPVALWNSCSSSSYICTYFTWKAKKQRLSICWCTPQMASTAGGRGRRKAEAELHLGRPHAWQGPKYLNHRLLSPMVCTSRSWNWKWSQDFNPNTPMWDAGAASSVLTTIPNSSPKPHLLGEDPDTHREQTSCARHAVTTREESEPKSRFTDSHAQLPLPTLGWPSAVVFA